VELQLCVWVDYDGHGSTTGRANGLPSIGV
jgi:hypothetical protein